MSSLREQAPSVEERVVRSPWPEPEVPDLDLVSFVLRHAVRLADLPAVIDGASGRTVTYGELAGGIERVAAGLAARGFGRGDVLALHLPNLPEFPMVLYGGLRAGGAVTPASPLFTAGELARQLRSTGAGILITVGPLAAVAREAAAQAGVDDVIVLGEPSFGELMAGGGAPPESRPDPSEVAVMLSSSGTTGLPKAVELTHRALVANLVQMAVPFPIEEGERVLGLAPFFHSMGLGCVLNHALANGGTVVALARFDLEVTAAGDGDPRGPAGARGAAAAGGARPPPARLVLRSVRAAHGRQRRGTRRRRARAGRRRAARLPRRAGVRHHRGVPAGRRLSRSPTRR